jgi:hypothetical protein
MGNGRDESIVEPIHNSLKTLAYGTLFGMLITLLASTGIYFTFVRIPLAVADVTRLPLSRDTWFIIIRTIGFGKFRSSQMSSEPHNFDGVRTVTQCGSGNLSSNDEV